MDLPKWMAQKLLGEHPLMRRVRTQAAQYLASDWPILITGETGTGKDFLARIIHSASARGNRNPEVIAAGGLGETAWSTLFGHKKGAFTNALADHEGVFTVANGSSVLIEDVTDLPPRIQPVLLRAIEHGLYRPLGCTKEIFSNARVIATSNRLVDDDIREGRFRADLYERLAVLKIVIPPLRTHLEDLKVYVQHFLRKATPEGQPAKTMSDSGMELLSEHSWPRNIRELENLVRRAVVEVSGDIIGEDACRRLLRSESLEMQAVMPSEGRRIDKALLYRTLVEACGNKRQAARHLGVSPGKIYRLMKRYRMALDLDLQEVP